MHMLEVNLSTNDEVLATWTVCAWTLGSINNISNLDCATMPLADSGAKFTTSSTSPSDYETPGTFASTISVVLGSSCQASAKQSNLLQVFLRRRDDVIRHSLSVRGLLKGLSTFLMRIV